MTQNIYTNTSTKGLSKKQSFSQFNALNNSEECERNLGFGDMQSSCERNKFEYEKDSYKIISPLNLPNSSFGFPIFSTTNSSFNLNFENVINVNKEKEKNVIDDGKGIFDKLRRFRDKRNSFGRFMLRQIDRNFLSQKSQQHL